MLAAAVWWSMVVFQGVTTGNSEPASSKRNGNMMVYNGDFSSSLSCSCLYPSSLLLSISSLPLRCRLLPRTVEPQTHELPPGGAGLKPNNSPHRSGLRSSLYSCHCHHAGMLALEGRAGWRCALVFSLACVELLDKSNQKGRIRGAGRRGRAVRLEVL